MFKRAMILAVLSLMITMPAVSAQEETPEPGPGAASQLPEAMTLGDGWVQLDVVSPDVLGQFSFEMSPDVFSEGAAGLYGGPNGSRIVVVNLIVTDSRVAVRASWEDATELMDRLTWTVNSDYRRMEALETESPPAPCVEAKRVEGIEDGYLTSVGATMCAQDPDNLWIFVVSGTWNDASGVEASDALTVTVLGE